MILACLTLAFVRAVVASDLPDDCLYQPFHLPPVVSNSVKCDVDGLSKDYDPVKTAQAISKVAHITTLVFQVNIPPEGKNVTDAEMTNIAANLNSPTVTDLTIILGDLEYHNSHVTVAGLAHVSALNAVAHKNLRSFTFNVGTNSFDDTAVGIIAGNLPKFTALEAVGVDVSVNKITDAGLSALVQGLTKLPAALSSVELNVGHNKLRSGSALVSAAGSLAQSHPTLESFTLAYDQDVIAEQSHFIDDADFSAIMSKVGNMKALRTLGLNFRGNHVGDVGFATMLDTVHSSLTKLVSLTSDFNRNNTISPKALHAAPKSLAAFQAGGGKWNLMLENNGPDQEVSFEAYGAELACLKPETLNKPVPLYDKSLVFPGPGSPSCEYTTGASVSSKCKGGIEVATTGGGGPCSPARQPVCVTCKA